MHACQSFMHLKHTCCSFQHSPLTVFTGMATNRVKLDVCQGGGMQQGYLIRNTQYVIRNT